jgi:outer membrane lipoprotein-sorting protein
MATAVGVLALALWAFLCDPVPMAHAAEFGLETVLRRIAANQRDVVGFEERRFLGVVTEPLESSGTLRFEPPDRLIKETDKPYRETAIVDGDRLTVLDAAGVETRSISLWVSEELRLVFDSLRAVLRGDAKTLASLFQVAVTGNEKAWEIELTPQPGDEEGQIERITVRGSAGRVERFDIRETNGDRALIRLTGPVQRS